MPRNTVRLLLILPAIVALVWLVPESGVKWPGLTALLGVPLAFGLVPRNVFYGHRTLHTLLGSEAVWYLHNRFTGIAMVIAGLVWLAFALR